MKGVITRVVREKGFGFLRGVDDGLDRYFQSHNVHSDSTVLFRDLEDGQEVEFEPYSLPPPASDQPSAKVHNNLRARKVRA